MTHQTIYKIQFITLALFISIVLIPQSADTTMWVRIPLVNRVIKADYIVVGRLMHVEKQAVCIEHQNFLNTGKPARFYLDTGMIQATKILYPVSVARRDPSPEAFKFPFASHSRSHPQGNGNHMKSSSHFHFDEGAEGIWILERNHFVDHLTVTRPANFLPIDSLEVVKSAIAQVSKLTSQKQHPKSQ